jgi:hypothetical protein
MTDLLLTRLEIVDLTGARTRAGQIAVLRNNGIRHFINRAGWPVVPRSAIDATPATRQDQQPWQPRKAG